MITQQSPPQTQPRLMRVFVSSTFRDMQEERDELAKFIFPQLRKLCEQRGVTWGEVDLRWGITDEQKAEGKVLHICLDEIQRCRPYFIGLLGERYGWIPDEIPPRLIEREPWLVEHKNHSVTELEILHGVLNKPEMAEHAFFYYRDPAYIHNLPVSQQSDYIEAPTAEEVKKLGRKEATHRAEARQIKLAALKKRIRRSGLPVHENFHDPNEFGRLVLQDLTTIIDDLYPEGSQPDPLDREAAEHETFARSRSRVYIGRQTYFDQLDAHARADSPPLVILGESGSGKSALLANWGIRYRTEHPDDFVLMHFIGATPGSADWAAMLRRILGEFKRKFDIRKEIPDQSDALRKTFANWLNMAAAQGRVVLILDALNQLDDRDGAPDLVWLPPHIPENVRIFLSTLPSRPLEELKRRGWPSLTIGSLQPEERRQLIKEYLALFTKSLDPAHMESIASAPQCQNPLFLRVLLDELRLFGMHERLGDQIGLYLKAATVPALYELILKRCEQDYERERPGLVHDSMSLLCAARRGLSEAELMDLLGVDGQPLPRAHWSPLSLAMEQSLLSRSGLIGFAHDYLRQAVQNLYLSTGKAQHSEHLQLAAYFENRELNLRKIDELPWQLAQAGSWQRLYHLLAYLPFFTAAWKTDPFIVKAYWAQIEGNSKLKLTKAYHSVINAPARDTTHVPDIAKLLADTGHPMEAMSLQEYLVEHFRQTDDRVNLQTSLGILGWILTRRGDLERALVVSKEQELICRDLGDKHGLQMSLGIQSWVKYFRGDLNGAIALQKEQERICRKLGDKGELQASLVNQGKVLVALSNLDGAMALFKENERICRSLGNKSGLSASLGEQASIFFARGDLDGTIALQKEQELICRELGDKEGLGLSLGNQAVVLATRGNLDGAMVLFKENERICQELGNKKGLIHMLGNQANILYDRGDLDGAMTLLKEQECICRDLEYKNGLARTLGSQALILRDRGNLDGAMELHKEEERICLELGDKDWQQTSLNGQALILKDRGDLDGAMALLKEKESICRELGLKEGLQASLGNQGNILRDRGDLDGAMTLHKEEERICRELGLKSGMQASLGSQALILKDRGDLDGAMALLKEKERICRELGLKEGLATSLINQASILGLSGIQAKEALFLADEAYRTAAEHGYVTLTKQIEGDRAKIRERLGDK